MDEDSPKPLSISARIAALNTAQLGRVPDDPPPSYTTSQSYTRPTPPLPPSNRPSITARLNTTNNPPIHTNGISSKRGLGNEPSGEKNGVLPPPDIIRTGQRPATSKPSLPPRLPPREDSSPSSPALPPRRPSGQASTRRDSTDSISSSISNVSALSSQSNRTRPKLQSRAISGAESSSRIKAPEYNPSALPTLPPKRSQTSSHARTPLRTRPAQGDTAIEQAVPALPSLPPRLPLRRSETTSSAVDTTKLRRLPPETPVPVPTSSTFSNGLKDVEDSPPALPGRRPKPSPSPAPPDSDTAPPPIPLASRPKAIIPGSNISTPSTSSDSCLICRDYSGPDNHAARFPTSAIPNTSPQWIARQLCSPFPSHTDKARAIFTWLHHNIAYDTHSFFNNSIKASTPENTIARGLAVCEGYAGLFSALALHAGIQAIVIGGHGKGYGYQQRPPGSAVEPFDTNHAWNAVQIDGGEWHLIDCCWGAGQLDCATNQYKKNFVPERFTQSSADFGLDHFPSDKAHFFLPPGVSPPTWEQYIIGAGEPPLVFGGPREENQISKTTFAPKLKHIDISSAPVPTTRFSFALPCPHYTPPPKPHVFFLEVHNSRKNGGDDRRIFDTNGRVWWVDVPTQELGKKGENVQISALTSLDGRDGRGVTKEEFEQAIGRKAMMFGFLARWELV